MSGAVVHFEINGADSEQLAKFYGELFGWQTQLIPEMGYAMVDTQGGGGINGGIGRTEGGSKFVTFYVEVPEPQAALDKAEKLGGKIRVPVTEVPNVVTFAQFTDPEGNIVGIVQGDGTGGEGAVSPGSNPAVAWFEVLGKDAAKLQKFYADLFGWTIKKSEAAGEQYGEVEAPGGRGIPGGIGAGPEGVPHVTVYARVDDLRKYLERAESLGGKITLEPMDVGQGTTVAAFQDPQGTVFGIFRMEQ